ncbi:MAG: cysteine desulfurase, partial [Candidatus Babeliaceae bacterium]|nr:cysteine desulfurase [Candidatus Babeliaceae bacterium]
AALKNRNRGRHLITSAFEHHAVINSCCFLQELKYKITILPVERNGHVSTESLQKALTPETTLVSIMLANNEIGTIQSISNLTQIVHENNTLFHSDAVQAVGHIPVDVNNLKVDLLSASAHKFNGPKGIGFLYLRKGTEILSWSSGGKQENNIRAGTENVASIIGMAVALKKNVDNINEKMVYLRKLSDILLRRLTDAGVDFLLNGDSDRLPGNLNISIRNQDGEALLHRLDLCGILVSTGAACNSGTSDASHVIKALGTPREYANGTIRISLSKDNTVEDVLAISEAIITIVTTPYPKRKINP